MVEQHDRAADLVEMGLEVFGLPFLEDAVQIPIIQEEQRVLFMLVFFTGRRRSERKRENAQRVMRDDMVGLEET